MPVSFKTSSSDRDLIYKIVDRVRLMMPNADPVEVSMDIAACHTNGNPLRLADLLEAPDFDFGHDINGIRNHIDRKTGKLRGHFLPRFHA